MSKNYVEKQMCRLLAIFVIPVILSGVVQILVPGTSVVCMGITAGIIIVYLGMQEQLISEDALTGLYNRRLLGIHLTERLSDTSSEKPLYLFMMDVDEFKTINDKYGHIEGDVVLCLIADILKECETKYNCFAARFGGDEFCIVSNLKNDFEAETICKFIRNRVKLLEKDRLYPINISIGYTHRSEEFNNESRMVLEADRQMYIRKRRTGNANQKLD